MVVFHNKFLFVLFYYGDGICTVFVFQHVKQLALSIDFEILCFMLSAYVAVLSFHISCFRPRVHLLFHWCLYNNKNNIFFRVSCLLFFQGCYRDGSPQRL